jgi:hypothetical protein
VARNADAKIDDLYAADPGEFVERRDRLARSLRDDGDREAADEVKKLRKPSVAAWTVNQLARREKMRLRGLFTAGERLRAAHEDVLAGGPHEALEQARDDERRALNELASAARSLLEDAGHPPTEAVLDRVRDTLHAAVVDEGLGERVRAGRLEKEERATGFGFTSLPGTTAQPRKPKAKQATGRRQEAKDDAAAKRRERAEEAAREKRLQAEEGVRAARAELAEAEKAVKRAARDLDRAEREVETRRTAVERAEAALRRARSAR